MMKDDGSILNWSELYMGLKHQPGTVLGHLPINQRTWGMKQEANISWYRSIVEHVQHLGEHDMYSMNSLFVDKFGNKVNEPGFWEWSRKLGAAYIPGEQYMEFLGNSQLSSIVLVSDVVVTRKCKTMFTWLLHGVLVDHIVDTHMFYMPIIILWFNKQYQIYDTHSLLLIIIVYPFNDRHLSCHMVLREPGPPQVSA
jgi:hypothetical protein